MPKPLAIVLCDGRINGVVTAALAAQRHQIVLLHPEPPGRPAVKSREAFDRVIEHFAPHRHHPLPMTGLAALGRPARPAAADPRVAPNVRPTLLEQLPLVAAAARFAAHYDAASIHLDLSVGESADAYAAGSEYVQVWNELLQLPCGLAGVEVVAPLLELEPWQVVDLGVQAAAPLDLAWDCDEDGPAPCAHCPGCRARADAYRRAGRKGA